MLDDAVAVGEGVDDAVAGQAAHLGVDQVADADEQDLLRSLDSCERQWLCSGG